MLQNNKIPGIFASPAGFAPPSGYKSPIGCAYIRYVIDMTQRKTSELMVITKAKELCAYVVTITQKSPKNFRYTFVSRMQNLALDVIESLYRANDTYVTSDNPDNKRIRLDFQHKALTDLKVLSYFSMLALDQKCIILKQYEEISRIATDCQNLIGAWINSDRRRMHQQ